MAISDSLTETERDYFHKDYCRDSTEPYENFDDEPSFVKENRFRQKGFFINNKPAIIGDSELDIYEERNDFYFECAVSSEEINVPTHGRPTPVRFAFRGGDEKYIHYQYKCRRRGEGNQTGSYRNHGRKRHWRMQRREVKRARRRNELKRVHCFWNFK